MIEFLIVIYYRVKLVVSYTFLEEYTAKSLCVGICAYFHLSISIAIKNFKHGCRYHAIFYYVGIIQSV